MNIDYFPPYFLLIEVALGGSYTNATCDMQYTTSDTAVH